MYTFNSKIRYSEAGEDGKLSLAGIINYFQDCSTFQSENLGLGIEKLKAVGKAWFLNSWQIVINRRPEIGEEIKTATKAYEFKGFSGCRNFMIYDTDDKLCAYANSVWSYIDLNRNRPVKYEQTEGAGYPIEEALPMDKTDRKIILPDNIKEVTDGGYMKIRSSLIDTNSHVNNSAYVKLALDFMPEHFFLDEDKIKQVRVEYKKALKMGDIVNFEYMGYKSEGKIYTVLKMENGDISAVLEFADKPFGLEEK